MQQFTGSRHCLDNKHIVSVGQKASVGVSHGHKVFILFVSICSCVSDFITQPMKSRRRHAHSFWIYRQRGKEPRKQSAESFQCGGHAVSIFKSFIVLHPRAVVCLFCFYLCLSPTCLLLLVAVTLPEVLSAFVPSPTTQSDL